MPMDYWSEFRLEMFGEPYLVWHEGADFAAILRRYRSDPAEVAAQLSAGLAMGDNVAAQAMGEIGDVRFVPELRRAFETQPGDVCVSAALAYLRITGDQSASTAVCAVLAGDPSEFVRSTAARALRKFAATSALIDAAAAGVRDPDYLVRFHSADSLLAFAGKAPDISSNKLLFSRLTSDAAPASWSSASDELAKAARAKLR